MIVMRTSGTSEPDGHGPQRASGPVIHVVDDEPMAVKAMKRLLLSAGRSVRTYESAEAFLRAAAANLDGCLLLDVQMPGLDGLALQEKLQEAGCLLPVIFLTGHGDIPSSVRAMKAGAVDYLCKPVQEAVLFAAIERALQKSAREKERGRSEEESRRRAQTLTPRERQVFSLVVSGLMNKEIAALLGTAEKTVKVHRGRVMGKMAARSLAQLVRMAAAMERPAT